MVLCVLVGVRADEPEPGIDDVSVCVDVDGPVAVTVCEDVAETVDERVGSCDVVIVRVSPPVTVCDSDNEGFGEEDWLADPIGVSLDKPDSEPV